MSSKSETDLAGLPRSGGLRHGAGAAAGAAADPLLAAGQADQAHPRRREGASRNPGRNAGRNPRRPRRPWSLAARLTLWYAASAFLLLLLSTGALYAILSINLHRESDRSLVEQVEIVRDVLHHRPQESSVLLQEVVYEPGERRFNAVLVRLLDEQGNLLMETPGMEKVLPRAAFPPPADAGQELGSCADLPRPSGRIYRVLTARAVASPASPAAAEAAADDPVAGRLVQVARDHTAQQRLLDRYRHRLWFVLGGGLLLCTGSGYLIARRGVQPVWRVTEVLERTGSSNLGDRIDPDGFPREIADLAAKLNGMLDRLQDAFARLTRFSGDIAHELRTPLNILRGEAEVALAKARTPEQYREVLTSSLEEFGRLSRMIDGLLFLARAEDPQTHVRRDRADLRAELASLLEFYEPLAADAGVELRLLDGPPAEASVDRTLLQRAVGNLIENALAHTGRLGVDGSAGHVLLAARPQNGTVSVEVADDGCGIPADDLPHVFDRFRRVDQSRSRATGGAGLGLAIVKTIVALHGGMVDIASEVGRGTRVTLSLPASPNLPASAVPADGSSSPPTHSDRRA